MGSLTKLKELTKVLPPVPHLSEMIHNPGGTRSYIEYNVNGGTCIGFGLLNQEQIAVQKIFISSGTEFPLHTHEIEKEFGIIYSGLLKVFVEDEEYIVNPGECIEFCCNQKHKVIALDDTWLIAVSIPAIDGYPK